MSLGTDDGLLLEEGVSLGADDGLLLKEGVSLGTDDGLLLKEGVSLGAEDGTSDSTFISYTLALPSNIPVPGLISLCSGIPTITLIPSVLIATLFPADLSVVCWLSMSSLIFIQSLHVITLH